MYVNKGGIELEKYLDIFKALSDKTRLRIFHLYCRYPQEMCVCEIVDALQESQYKVSRHLKILKYARLVQETKKGKWVYYDLAKTEDQFIQTLISGLVKLHDDQFSADAGRLEERFALRVNGECVVGMDRGKIDILPCSRK
jgi:ArsR family transcriptional regulator, arsenate/arsenite/antimonite-responsive transcriptional repressor